MVEAGDNLFILYPQSLGGVRSSYNRFDLWGQLLRKRGFTARAEMVLEGGYIYYRSLRRVEASRHIAPLEGRTGKDSG